MPFDRLTEAFEGVFKKIRGEGRLTEDNIRESMREVRLALLDADVNFKVVKDFIKSVTEKAVGQETLKSVRPAEQIIKIVHEELVAMLGSDTAVFELENKFDVVMLLGLQGSGKTTFSGKLSHWCRKKGRKPFLIACDIYRPAAVDQLVMVGKSIDVPVFEMGTDTPVTEIATRGIAEAKKQGCDLVIIDTAGRLHIDEVKMEELVGLKKATKPTHTFLVADSMTGQDALNSASAFNDGVGIEGVCLTKIDGDARGGAALSIRAVTGRPIYFMGTGEKPSDLEIFHPERIASRILGMGDVVSLVEKAQEQYDQEQALEMQRKLKKEQYSLQDFMDHIQKMKMMGPLSGLMKMLPGGLGKMGDMIGDDAFKPMEAMISSMTPAERENPSIIDGSRRKRISKGSGIPVQDINEMLREFDGMRKMMGQMMGGGGKAGAGMGANLRTLMGGGSPVQGQAPDRVRARGGAGGGGAATLTKTKPKHRRKQKSKANNKKKKSR